MKEKLCGPLERKLGNDKNINLFKYKYIYEYMMLASDPEKKCYHK